MKEGAGPYRVMPNASLAADGLVLRAVEPGDIEMIRQWRNAQMDVLRQFEPISPEQQTRYFTTHVWPQKQKAEPAQILLAIERDDALIGYGGLVHLSWADRRGEVSFLLTPELERLTELVTIFAAFLALMKRLAFEDLGLDRLVTETFDHRTRHIATLEAAGFRREGRLRAHVVVENERRDALIHGCLATDIDETP